MAKIQKIEVKNFKAIAEETIEFKGCTAIITAGNNKGKTSLLRGIIDRIRGEKPDLIVKQGEKEGHGTLELTTGEKFTWEFDSAGTDKLVFYTKEGYKTKVTREIVARFFPPAFDVDAFLNSEPRKQTQQLQKILGVDFSEIQNRYTLAYNDRTEKNKEAERFQVKLAKMLEVTKVVAVDLTELLAEKETIRKKLNDLYLSNKTKNESLRKGYDELKEKTRKEIEAYNTEQANAAIQINQANDSLSILVKLGYTGGEVAEWIKFSLPVPQNQKVFNEELLVKPEYITPELPNDSELQAVDQKLLAASETNAKAKEYTDYMAYKQSVDEAQEEAKLADEKVKAIEAERKQLIAAVKMPAGISFGSDGGILVDGFPLDKTQISTSKLYCAALRIGSMNLGEVHSLHFDASFLDKNTLAEIEAWADRQEFDGEQGLQLLIERVDFEDGNIQYKLVEN